MYFTRQNKADDRQTMRTSNEKHAKRTKKSIHPEDGKENVPKAIFVNSLHKQVM